MPLVEGSGAVVEGIARVQESAKQRVDSQLAPIDAESTTQHTAIHDHPPQTQSETIHAFPPQIQAPSFPPKLATDDTATQRTDALPPIIHASLPPPLPAASARNSTQLLLNRSLSKGNHLAIDVNRGSTSGSGLESGSTASGVVIGKDKPKEVIRIERDWSNGEEIVQFWSGWVWELEGRVCRSLRL